MRYLSADDPTGEWRLVMPRQNETEYSVEDRGDHLFITVRCAWVEASVGRTTGLRDELCLVCGVARCA